MNIGIYLGMIQEYRNISRDGYRNTGIYLGMDTGIQEYI